MGQKCSSEAGNKTHISLAVTNSSGRNAAHLSNSNSILLYLNQNCATAVPSKLQKLSGNMFQKQARSTNVLLHLPAKLCKEQQREIRSQTWLFKNAPRKTNEIRVPFPFSILSVASFCWSFPSFNNARRTSATCRSPSLPGRSWS